MSMLNKDELFEKHKDKIVSGNRAERRRKEKNFKNKIDNLDRLTPAQIKLVEEVIQEREIAAENKGVNTAFQLVDKYNDVMDRCLTAFLYINNKGFKKKDIEAAIMELADLINDYELKNGLEGEKEMADLKNNKEIVDFIKKVLNLSKTDKENLEDIYFKFPKASKASLTNLYHEIKEEINIEAAAEYIFAEEPKAQIEKPKRNKLKIKRMVLEGEFDTYEIEENHVHLVKADLGFKNLNDVNKFKQQKTKEINDFIEEVTEALSMRK